ncbi:NfeD family protein [Thermasporomyces composti]|jgi:membrane protein implicated in regulation of membrane protease activity|uniref:Membrane protein implicated in regulation of membrane protease activity n=1 Tax=Thermasporomyces composti TaxID=696763 RepID=A0A3D9VA07_THECX|nr:NfeD family protein [Thermasporomyces composti]REF38309.1 membrane protein implicated in regulation of membrane protease activity [Thermasporomyces composti]
MSDLLHWLGDHLWVMWAVIAGLLAAVELLTLDLVFLMLAAGAAAGAVAAAVGGGPIISVVVSVVVALGMLAAVRPVALRHLKQGSPIRTGVAALVGQPAVVMQEVSPTSGTVKIHGEIWSARPYDGQSTIEPGKTVEVLSIDGATAYVHETEKPW